MTAKRSYKKRRAWKISDSGNFFQSLASEIASPRVSPNSILRLSHLLGHLSLTQPIINWENSSWDIRFSGKQVESINLDNICNLSDVLFTELDRRFGYLFATLFKDNAETPPTFASIEESIQLATLFLRCCVKIMLLLPQQELVMEKAKTLLSILSGLMRARGDDFSFVFTDDGPLDPRYTFLRTSLEVFMDEIWVNRSIRDLLVLVDSAFSSCRLFSKHHMANMVEMVSADFIFSLSDEKMNKMYVERLYLNQVNAFTTPQISLTAAAFLLQNPVLFSAPRTIHAYVVSLVSDAISSCSPKGLHLQLIDCYIDAFEKSVILYTRHMCKGENASSGNLGVSRSNSQVPYEHLLLPSTLKKVNYLTLKLKESWGACQSNNAKRDNNELVAYSVAYAKKSLCVFDSSCSENMLSILGCMVLRASSDDVMDSVLQKYNASRIEDLCLLSSTLKLMSCSMLKAIQVLGNWNGDVRACKEYERMMDVVQRFEQFSVHLPGQSFLRDRMESHPHRNVKSKWMLMHFSGLLSVSFALKLDFLMKDSVFGMLLSLYLFILEGGNLEALSDSVCHSENPSSSLPSSGSKDSAASGKAEETAADRRLSGEVARKFHKIRTLYLGKVSEAKDGLDAQEWDPGVGVEESRCNAETFLWCMPGKDNLRSTDVEELADYIACEPDKDYSEWLKVKERCRSLRSVKTAMQRWNKKKKAWRRNKRKGC